MAEIKFNGDLGDLIDWDAVIVKALEKACICVENDAKRKVPVDTGELKRSITHEIVRKEDGSLVGVVGTNKAYAPYVEFGTGLFASNGDGRKDVPWCYQTDDGEWHSTVGQHPQPYLAPALNENRQAILNILKQEINNAGLQKDTGGKSENSNKPSSSI